MNFALKTPFTDEEQNLDSICFEKRRTTNPLLRGLRLGSGSRAIMMPGSHDNDQSILKKTIIDTIERDRKAHAYQQSIGLGTTPRPMEVDKSLAYYAKTGRVYDLICLDLYGLITKRYLKGIRSIFGNGNRDGMLRRPGTLMVTTGFAQSNKEQIELERQARKEGWNKDYPATPMHLRSLMASIGVQFRDIREPSYRSFSGHLYVVTVVSL